MTHNWLSACLCICFHQFAITLSLPFHHTLHPSVPSPLSTTLPGYPYTPSNPHNPFPPYPYSSPPPYPHTLPIPALIHLPLLTLTLVPPPLHLHTQPYSHTPPPPITHTPPLREHCSSFIPSYISPSIPPQLSLPNPHSFPSLPHAPHIP